jgi:tRNA A-37 threonylcarbamoyl transferase component Bud32
MMEETRGGSGGSDQPTIEHAPGSAPSGTPVPTTDGGSSGPVSPVGRRVGDYELLGELGRGGMGVVYRARHTKLGRVAALKMIRAGELAAAGERDRFAAEAQAAATLDHPNIVSIHDVGEQDGRPYYAMRLIEGESLAAALPRLKGDGRRAAALVEAVARAVDFAHRRGVLHRDLKPANILIDAAGEPHVTDFGLAKRFEADSRLTATGTVMGTPAYIPPEQASGKRGEVSTASDVYAIGAILYELLCGRPPFRGETAGDILYQVLEAEPERPSSVAEGVDADLETIALKCLEKEPGRRYASALELADDLARWRAGEPIAARPATRLERARKWARRHPGVAALAGTLVMVIVASFAAVVGLWREAARQAENAREQARALRAQTLIAERQTQVAKAEARRRAEAEQVAKAGLEALGTLSRSTRRAREVVGQLWSTGNLRTIGQALGRYHRREGRFPPAAIVGADGAPLLSWRVAILPDLGLGELYERFRKDEPWDSPRNLALLAEMPPVYRGLGPAGDPALLDRMLAAGRAIDPVSGSLLANVPRLLGSGENVDATTPFRAVVGPGAMFEGAAGLPRDEARNGPDRTLMVVEADRAVPWTKPEELSYDPSARDPLPGLDDRTPGGLLGLYADGQVRRLRPNVEADVLRRLILRNAERGMGNAE